MVQSLLLRIYHQRTVHTKLTAALHFLADCNISDIKHCPWFDLVKLESVFYIS
jgi:hypothetical protein